MLLIKNAFIKTMAGTEFENGSIVIEGKRIKEVGNLDLSKYKDAEVIDAKGQIVTPGLIDPHCHIGGWEKGVRFEGQDVNEMTSPITPELRAIDAVYMNDGAFEATYKSGITTVNTGPGSANIIGGTFTAIKTYGEVIDDVIIKAETSMKMALGENPKFSYGKNGKAPYTRMASAALMREWLTKAKEYHRKYHAWLNKEEDAKEPAFDMKLHSLMRVFDGMIVKIHAHRTDDIATALRITKEFGLNTTIEHASEAHLMPNAVKKSGVPLIIGPVLVFAGKQEAKNKTFEAARILEENDIPFAIMTDHPVIPMEHTLIQVALFVKEGLSRETALKSITINAAKLNGIEDRVGSLEVGKDADVVIWDGDILDIMTRPEVVIIDGKVIHTK